MSRLQRDIGELPQCREGGSHRGVGGATPGRLGRCLPHLA
jgi:hypothetical protein